VIDSHQSGDAVSAAHPFAAESYTTVDETHQPSSYPHGRHVGIGFEMLVLSLRYRHWTRIISQVRIPVFDMLTLGSRLDMLALGSRRLVSRCRGWFRDVSVSFEMLALGSSIPLVGFETLPLVGFEMLALGSG